MKFSSTSHFVHHSSSDSEPFALAGFTNSIHFIHLTNSGFQYFNLSSSTTDELANGSGTRAMGSEHIQAKKVAVDGVIVFDLHSFLQRISAAFILPQYLPNYVVHSEILKSEQNVDKMKK